ncbi:MAG: peptidylprolyl isomerase [Candidatus Kryptoniota bacterium]
MSGLKLLPLFALLSFMIGCSSLGGLESNIVPPTLIEKTLLPPTPPTVDAKDFYLKLELLISKEGKVLHATLQNTSGDQSWDSLAVQCVMQWKYAPATSDGKPVQLKIEQTARVVVTPPMMMQLSEIVCPTLSEADSVYSALEKGAAFDSLAKTHSISSSAAAGGYLGEIDIHNYQDEIESVLKDLKPGEYTHPLPWGQNYVIYKRQTAEKSTTYQGPKN